MCPAGVHTHCCCFYCWCADGSRAGCRRDRLRGAPLGLVQLRAQLLLPRPGVGTHHTLTVQLIRALLMVAADASVSARLDLTCAGHVLAGLWGCSPATLWHVSCRPRCSQGILSLWHRTWLPWVVVNLVQQCMQHEHLRHQSTGHEGNMLVLIKRLLGFTDRWCTIT